MALFLMIYEGPTPATAKSILVSKDPALLRLVAEELSRRLMTADQASQIARILEQTQGWPIPSGGGPDE